MKVIGICGPIGSGKSLVRKIFEHFGIPSLDADQVVHRLYEARKPGARKIAKIFGQSFLDNSGGVDRKKLGRFVFTHAEKLPLLNRSIHPLVIREVRKWLTLQKRKKSHIVVLEAFYFESDEIHPLVDYLIGVDAPRVVCFRRLHRKRNMSRTFFDRIWKFQVRYAADFIVENKGSICLLEKKVRDFLASME